MHAHCRRTDALIKFFNGCLCIAGRCKRRERSDVLPAPWIHSLCRCTSYIVSANRHTQETLTAHQQQPSTTGRTVSPPASVSKVASFFRLFLYSMIKSAELGRTQQSSVMLLTGPRQTEKRQRRKRGQSAHSSGRDTLPRRNKKIGKPGKRCHSPFRGASNTETTDRAGMHHLACPHVSPDHVNHR